MNWIGVKAYWNNYWYGEDKKDIEHEKLDRARLAIFRILFFCLLAYDVNMHHKRDRLFASRFNVSHLPWLYEENPIYPIVLQVHHVYQMRNAITILSLFAAMDILYEFSTVVITLFYGIIYFASMTDSYQHHYLIFLLCFISIFLKRKWAQRLLVTEVGIVYFWTSITKLDYQFLSGRLVTVQLTTEWFYEYLRFFSSFTGISDLYLYPMIGIGTVGIELFFALMYPIAFRYRRGNWITWFLGSTFHVTIQLFRFRILYFSGYMVILYLLVLPDLLTKYFIPKRLYKDE